MESCTRERGGGGGGFLAYEKDGWACRKFCKEPLRGTKILFCRRGLKWFTLRGTPKAPAVELYGWIPLEIPKPPFLTPKRYDQHSCPFYNEIPPPPGSCAHLHSHPQMFFTPTPTWSPLSPLPVQKFAMPTIKYGSRRFWQLFQALQRDIFSNILQMPDKWQVAMKGLGIGRASDKSFSCKSYLL